MAQKRAPCERMKNISSTFMVLLALLNGEATALKDVIVTMPQAANIGDTITLQCHYDLEGEDLYTVKWYIGSLEFFRYIPKEMPSTMIFPTDGMEIDLSKSNPNQVVLKNVNQNVTGRYLCEVSTDIPHFYTKKDVSYLYIVQTPVGEPVVSLERDMYEINYTLRGNCTSPPSYPAMNLTWYLNGKKEQESYRITVPTPDSVGTKYRPASTVIGLEMEIDPTAFKSGKMVLRCHGQFFNLYQSTAEELLEEEKPRPRPSSVLGTRDSASNILLPPLGLWLGSFYVIAAIVR